VRKTWNETVLTQIRLSQKVNLFCSLVCVVTLESQGVVQTTVKRRIIVKEPRNEFFREVS
jgi:hypothetical protein